MTAVDLEGWAGAARVAAVMVVGLAAAVKEAATAATALCIHTFGRRLEWRSRQSTNTTPNR